MKQSIIQEEFRDGYSIDRYAPRVEGSFLRIEWWTRLDDNIHCHTITPENVTAFYGIDDNSRIYNPNDRLQICSWLIAETYNIRGNAMIFEYISENSQNIDLNSVNERNHTDKSRLSNRYLMGYQVPQ